MFSFHSSSIVRKPSSTNTYPKRSVKRAPRLSTSFAERGAASTMQKAAGRIASPASTVEYSSTFCRNCWPMYIAPISEPNTMIPAIAATQNVGRAAASRS